MALNTYLFLKANGEDIQGDPRRQSMGPENVANSIEAMAFYHEVAIVALDSGASRSSSARNHGPISFVKRIDRSTPVLLDALKNNKSIDGVIKFFRMSSDEGVTEKHYEITITDGRVMSVRTEMMNNNFPEGADVPVMERVSIQYNTIEWTFEGSSGTTQAADNQQSAV